MKSQPERDRRLLTGTDIPFLLRQIPMAPKKLWIEGETPAEARGDITSDETRFLCVVGSRKHSTYARESVEYLIAGLSGHNICIVSGLALGIDSVAHEAAIVAGLKTIAFPGSGLDRRVLYPVASRELAERILEASGALISEFDPMQAAEQWTFPQRNRLMAGISHATLVIEAGENSGTLITSGHALDDNRIVMALPGQIFSPLTYGPHKLIRHGAIPIRSSEDILEALGLSTPIDDFGENIREKLPRPKEYFEKHRSRGQMNELEQKIIDIISIEATDYDTLSQVTGVDTTTLNVALSTLEIEGILSSRSGKISLT